MFSWWSKKSRTFQLVLQLTELTWNEKKKDKKPPFDAAVTMSAWLCQYTCTCNKCSNSVTAYFNRIWYTHQMKDVSYTSLRILWIATNINNSRTFALCNSLLWIRRIRSQILKSTVSFLATRAREWVTTVKRKRCIRGRWHNAIPKRHADREIRSKQLQIGFVVFERWWERNQ